MRNQIKRYELGNNITVEKLKKCEFREGGFMRSVKAPKFTYYQPLIEDIELYVEIGLNDDNTFSFDDSHSVEVVDDNICQPYYPFYNEEKDFPFLNKVIDEYNKTMDCLVCNGILKEKKLENKKNNKLKLVREVK